MSLSDWAKTNSAATSDKSMECLKGPAIHVARQCTLLDFCFYTAKQNVNRADKFRTSHSHVERIYKSPGSYSSKRAAHKRHKRRVYW